MAIEKLVFHSKLEYCSIRNPTTKWISQNCEGGASKARAGGLLKVLLISFSNSYKNISCQ